MKPTIEIKSRQNLNIFVGVIIAIMVFFMAIRVPLDSDFWWHINAGRATLNQHSPLLNDIFSFTKNGASWINHSWLSEIIYFWIFNLFGLTGIMIFVALVATTTMLIIFNLIKGPVILKAFLIIFAVMLTAVIWSPRPQLFSLLLFALLVSIFQKNEERSNKKLILYVAVLFVIWANLHAGFVIGIAYIALVLFGKLLDTFLNKDFIAYKNEIVFWGILVLVSIAATFINPNGLNIWKVQFDTINVAALQNFIPEWASPNFHELFQQPFLWVWLLFVGLISTGVLVLPFQKILPLVFFGALGFFSRRNIAPFAIIILPILGNLIIAFYDKKLQSRFNLETKNKLYKINSIPKPLLQKGINLSFIFLLGIILAVKIIYLGNPIVMQTYEKNSFPLQAINTIDSHELQGKNLLNSYTWGGYISWYNPEIKVFVDGRTDLFGDEIILDWIDMVSANEGWEDLFNKYQIDWVLLENDRPIIKELQVQQWDVFYEDNISSILIKP